MKLYHFTSGIHLVTGILPDGFLKRCESAVHPTIDDYGPRVVWFQSNPDPTHNLGLDGSLMVVDGEAHELNKREVCITVDIDDAQHWPEFAFKHGIEQEWYDELARRAGGSPPDEWWVVEREIAWREWKRVHLPSKGLDYGPQKISSLVNQARLATW